MLMAGMVMMLGALLSRKVLLPRVKPGYLRIEPDGLFLKRGFRTRKFAWRDFSRFELDISSEHQQLLAIYSDNNNAGRLAEESELIASDMLNRWDIDTGELLELLNASRARWGGQSLCLVNNELSV